MNNRCKLVYWFLLLLTATSLTACLKNTSEPEERDTYKVPDLLVDTETYWDETNLITPEKDGLTNPYFDAVIDTDQNIHLVYYEPVLPEEGSDDDTLYAIKYNAWNTVTSSWQLQEPLVVETLNHTDRLSLAIDANNKLYLAYRGGNPKACNGGSVMTDTMFAVFDGQAWQNYFGAIGYVERSAGPLLDGHAGGNADLKVDAQGNVHLTYQFLYEGCDENNFRYPDLFYAQKQPSQFQQDNRSDAEVEEQVSGNDYEQGGNYQNATGYVSDIIINEKDEPLVFYYADHAGALGEGLYMGSRSEDGNWTSEPIIEDCEITDVTAGQAPNGDLHVFFVADSCDETDDRFALYHGMKRAPEVQEDLQASDNEDEIQWQTGYVVNNVYVNGIQQHLDMTFNKYGQPQAVFYELETYAGNPLKNLISIELDSKETHYQRKDIAKWDDIGTYNKILTDDNHEIYVLTYSNDTKSIHLFVEGVDGRNN